ncbi:MAG: glycosyltransferase family 9 protein [bacterium]
MAEQTPARILFIKFSAIGDIVLNIPALRAIHAKFPQADIDWLTVRGYEGILAVCPYIKETLVIERPFRRSFSLADLRSSMRFLRDIARRRYDRVFNFQGNARSYLIECVAQPGFQAKAAALGRLIRESLLPPGLKGGRKQRGYPVDVTLADLETMGIPDAGRHLEYFLSEECAGFASEFLARHSLEPSPARPLIGLNPGVNWESKEYFEERYAAAADALVESHRADILIFGGPDDLDKANAVLGAMTHRDRAISCAGQTPTPNHAAALIARCSMFITNDTGLMHLAAAVGTPTVSIFGGTSPSFHAPRPQTGMDHIALCKGQTLPCWPCYRYYCQITDNRACMKPITDEDIVATARTLLSKAQ